MHLCPDPVFLYDWSVEGIKLQELLGKRIGFQKDKKNMVVMVNNRAWAVNILKAFRADYNLISVFKWYPGYLNIADIDPFQWLQVLKSADFVITSFFHAVCFSIILGTPFLSIGIDDSKASKISELCTEDWLTDRYTVSGVELRDQVQRVSKPFDSSGYVGYQRSRSKEFFSLFQGNYE